MKKVFIIAVLILFVLSSTAALSWTSLSSYGISDDEAIVVTWQNKHGRWCGCGPVQRVSTSYATEEEVKGYASNCYLSYLGCYGRYNIYSCGQDLKSYEYDARRCIR